MKKRWTQHEIDKVIRLYQTETARTIAQRIGRPLSSVKSVLARHGVKGNHRNLWSDADVAYLLANYKKKPAAVIARELNRAVHQIYQKARKLGLHTPCPMNTRQPGLRDQIRKRHAQGWSDLEIGNETGVDRHHIGVLRRSMGLPSNKNSQRQRDRVRENTNAQLAAAGVDSLNALRIKKWRDRIDKSGWPTDLSIRHVDILDALYEHGPMTRRQIADVVGMPWKGSRKSLVSNDPEGSYLAHLIKRGLVINLGRKVKNGGSGHNTCLYSLSLWTQKMTEEVA